MPLSKPVPRKKRHNRNVQFYGYIREDGLWDIEGCMCDIRYMDFSNFPNEKGIKAGEKFHELWLRLTIDDEYLIHDVEVALDHTPYEICANVKSAFDVLRGLSITRGFRKALREKLTGAGSCIHLYELVWYMSNVAFQTLSEVRWAKLEKDRSMMKYAVNSCYALSEESRVIKDNWPEYYKKPE